MARRIAALSAVPAWKWRAVCAAAVGQCRQCVAERRRLCGRVVSEAIVWWWRGGIELWVRILRRHVGRDCRMAVSIAVVCSVRQAQKVHCVN